MPNLPENKLKEEVYSNLGGINSKVGLYSNGPMEFQDMSNFDFQRPGALTQRWGSTLYQTQNFSGPISALYEYVKLSGSSYLIVGTSGAIWSGATTGQSQGLSFTFAGVTTSFFPYIADMGAFAGSVIERVLYPGVPIDDNQAQLLDLTSSHGATINSGFYIATQKQSDNVLDFAVFQNTLFAADGNKFFKYDGTTTSFVSLPPPVRSISTVKSGGSTTGFNTNSTYFALYASYVNSRNFEGPIWLIGTIQTMGGSYLFNVLGGSLFSPLYTFSTPLQYDISKINIYAYSSAVAFDATSATLWNAPYRYLLSATASGSTTTDVYINPSNGISLNVNTGAPPPDTTYSPLGFTIRNMANTKFVDEFEIVPFYPRFVEIHQNRLFSAGFSLQPSTVWFSDVGEPEGYQPDWNFEVRTNDGDRITGLREYNSRLYIFKQFSFSELSGDNPNNFFEREVSNQYGCLSNRAMIVYNDIMLFLDAKGIMQFNGAGLQCISSRVQPIFDSMNVTAALDRATMVHDKMRNEILIGIPTNGSTTNNVTVVYDYMSDQWSKYDGYSPATYAIAKQRFASKTALYGGYSGQVMNFGQSLMSDNGQGFTTYFKTGFHTDDGYTATKLWRRLWTNVDEVTGATVACNINFFQDYGSSIILNRTTYLSPFQTRLDFGIQSKSIAFEFSKYSATTMIRYYGHGLAYRHERNV
jgi:hypothetical protein